MEQVFEQQVIAFLERVTKSEIGTIAATTELIDSGIVDSLSIVNLITFLEEKSQTSIPFEEVDLDDFRCVKNIVSRFFGNIDCVETAF
ncbi:phosphopantetheine-binding protein [Plesiomonas sp.]|uniref:phosphopantetheine-binding protein n=1 Tax=Plesiomonas sp. TaxID=2486279 RepID=UPI003F2D299B